MLVWRLSRLAPRSLRRWAIRVVPADRRLGFVRRVVPLPKPRREIRRATEVVPVRGRVGARVSETASPVAVRRENLDRVIATLEAAGVEYFRLPHWQIGRTAVGVPDSYRPRVESLLEALGREGAQVRRIEIKDPDRGPGSMVRVCWPVSDPGARLILGAEYACEIEFWRRDDDRLVAPRDNPSVDVIRIDEESVEVPDAVFGSFCPADSAVRYRTRRPFAAASMDSVRFPVDVVYTWVDGSDPEWLARKTGALADSPWVTVNRQAANTSRYISHDELRYSLRSLHYYAPWVRRIFLVTDDQVPQWLNREHPQITVVSHREIFGDTGRLPTFNSMAIETRLHRVPGLAEHFLYFNDDVFLGRPVGPEMFFSPGGGTRFFLSKNRIDPGPPVPDEPPVMAAGKNNRALIEREFGRFLAYKTKHTPHAARRSVLEEIEQRCADEVLATASHQFRHPSDISMVSSLQHYWAYATGRSAPSDLEYMYTDIADPATPIRLARALRHREYHTFCLNDTAAEGLPAEEQAELLAEFLPAYFPFRSPYELSEPAADGPVVAPRAAAEVENAASGEPADHRPAAAGTAQAGTAAAADGMAAVGDA